MIIYVILLGFGTWPLNGKVWYSVLITYNSFIMACLSPDPGRPYRRDLAVGKFSSRAPGEAGKGYLNRRSCPENLMSYEVLKAVCFSHRRDMDSRIQPHTRMPEVATLFVSIVETTAEYHI